MSSASDSVNDCPVVTDQKNLLQRLQAGETIIGDGGFVFALEKRGYVKAGPWTPEAVMEHPDAVKQLHREFMRSGSDVMQTFTFYASDDKLKNRGNDASATWTCRGINEQACDLAREVANEDPRDACMVAGGVCQTPSYLSGAGKEACQQQFREQCECFLAKKVDFMIAEYFEHIEEMEWAIEVCLETGLPVCANMCIGAEGDMHGNTVEACAERMAAAGAHVIGLNCHFDPFTLLKGMEKVKAGLANGGYLEGPDRKFMMVQPLAFHTPDASKQGFIDLPEFPFALESRICTRFDMEKFARQAHELGITYIGGCCGFEPYHIRGIASELAAERGRECLASAKWIPGAGGLDMHTKPWVRARATAEYWHGIKPASGRPGCPCTSCPDRWGVTQGDNILVQQTQATGEDEIRKLQMIQQEKRAGSTDEPKAVE